MKVRIEAVKTKGYVIKNYTRAVDIINEKAIFGNIEGAKSDDLAGSFPDVVADFVDRNGNLIYSTKNSLDLSGYCFSGKSTFKINLEESKNQCDIGLVRKVVLYIVFRKYIATNSCSSASSVESKLRFTA